MTTTHPHAAAHSWFRLRRPPAILLVVLAAATLGVTLLLSLGVGSLSIPTSTAIEALISRDAEVYEHIVVHELRIPRTLIGIAAGASLGVAGVIAQTITRNPLGDPGILGVNIGAAFAIVLAIRFLDVTAPITYVWFAFAGALAAAVLVVGVASAGRGRPNPVRLALAGVIVTAVLGAWISAMLLVDRDTLDSARFWLVGSLTGRDPDGMLLIGPFIAAGLLLSAGIGSQLDVLALGETAAAGLGQRTALVRAGGAAIVVLLAGAAVSLAGPVAFVGLAVPHVLRPLAGSSHRLLIVLSAFGGATLLLVADVLGRILLRPSEIQAGVVTAIIGAPFLVAVARRAGESSL